MNSTTVPGTDVLYSMLVTASIVLSLYLLGKLLMQGSNDVIQKTYDYAKYWTCKANSKYNKKLSVIISWENKS